MSGWLSSGLYGWPFVATAFGLARIVAPRSRPSSSAVERLPYTQDVAGSNPAPGITQAPVTGWGLG
jgi:hypothetical protein